LSEIERAFALGAWKAAECIKGKYDGIVFGNTDVARLVSAQYRAADGVGAAPGGVGPAPLPRHPVERTCIRRFLSSTTFQDESARCYSRGKKRKLTHTEDLAIRDAAIRLHETVDTEVTARMILFDVNPHQAVSTSTISRRLRVDFKMPWGGVPRRLQLSPQDIAHRFVWAQMYRTLPQTFWTRECCFIDCKVWPCYTTGAARQFALHAAVRGCYKRKGNCKTGPAPIVRSKPHKHKHRCGTGHKSIMVCAGFGMGQCLFAVVVADGVAWQAAEYVRVVNQQLAQLPLTPTGDKLTLVRDRDPKGFDTIAGRGAEDLNAIPVAPLPCRSPNLMPLDYTFHSAVKTNLRAGEAAFAPNYTEPRPLYVQRLLQAYTSITQAEVDKGCGSMVRRLQDLFERRGDDRVRD
jgi:hypothetical protein